ncbi:O-methyltransferase [Cryptosporangium arvum]|uniref:Putative O-methyltransferase n=1 Tax=Cryptosporangium arvum DSM 44712 TaxID=927661 RepID=A0A010YPL2_9ACTN|nr:class I SAM-dependent methyltransferase [Cryptosporangium arvum]EXG82130.1 putative O-methyltransferase [Cryptosporangium arvum DSM 44712]
MAGQLSITPELSEYVRRVSLREDEILRSLREETALLPMGTAMQVPAEEGQFLAFLVGLTGASTVVEVGTFTGYSTLCMARAVRPGGRVITCDISPKWPDIGAPAWKRAGVADRIDLRIGEATRTLAALLTELGPGSVDLVFIDADKAGYARYYEAALALLAPAGLIVVDNTLFFGRVVDPAATDVDTRAIREFNELVRDDPRVELTLLPTADGITLLRRV